VRAAAVADFLQDLRARGSADLNAVLTTLNDGSLVRETLGHWIENRWIVVAPSSPLQALAGPGFKRDLTLAQFCGGGPAEEAGRDAAAPEGEEARGDDDP
jgi:hypothetical protein